MTPWKGVQDLYVANQTLPWYHHTNGVYSYIWTFDISWVIRFLYNFKCWVIGIRTSSTNSPFRTLKFWHSNMIQGQWWILFRSWETRYHIFISGKAHDIWTLRIWWSSSNSEWSDPNTLQVEKGNKSSSISRYWQPEI